MADDQGSILVLLLDVHLFYDDDSRGGKTRSSWSLAPDVLLQQILLYINSFLLLHDQNQLAVYAIHDNCSPLLHLSAIDETGCVSSDMPAAAALTKRLASLLQATAASASNVSAARMQQQPEAALSGALSRALCLVRRLQAAAAARGLRPARGARPRLLVLSGRLDAPNQYIPVMNAIFCAQRAEVIIDACVIAPVVAAAAEAGVSGHSASTPPAAGPGPDSAFLQQAAHMTGGVYCRPSAPAALMQYLLTLLAADSATRSLLRIAQPFGVDFRASCFCHKRAVDVGHVCSVCLSIFCRPLVRCATCGTQFTAGRTNAAAAAGGLRPAARGAAAATTIAVANDDTTGANGLNQ